MKKFTQILQKQYYNKKSQKVLYNFFTNATQGQEALLEETATKIISFRSRNFDLKDIL